MLSPANVYYWDEMVEPLRRMGREDLADVIEPKIAEYRTSKERLEESG